MISGNIFNMKTDTNKTTNSDYPAATYSNLRSRAAFCSALARQFHDRYEELAPLYGYKTREDTKTFDPESPNGQLMQAVCLQVVGPIIARLQAIASMQEYDQDDAHRLRYMARQFLSQNAQADSSALAD